LLVFRFQELLKKNKSSENKLKNFPFKIIFYSNKKKRDMIFITCVSSNMISNVKLFKLDNIKNVQYFWIKTNQGRDMSFHQKHKTLFKGIIHRFFKAYCLLPSGSSVKQQVSRIFSGKLERHNFM